MSFILSPSNGFPVTVTGAYSGTFTYDPAQLSRNFASAGAATLPANPVGFWCVLINGTPQKIPYYAT